MGKFQLAFAVLSQSVDAENVDLPGLKRMNDADLRARLGADGRNLSIAQVGNLQSKLIRQMQDRADAETAQAIVDAIRPSFVDAESEMHRIGDDRIVIIYLDGGDRQRQGSVEELK